MGTYSRHLYIIASLLAWGAAAIGTEALGQGCPCDDLNVGTHEPSRPDFSVDLSSPGLAKGVVNPVAACSGPFCGYECRSEGVIFAIEGSWLDVNAQGSDLAARLVAIKSGMPTSLGDVTPDTDIAPRLSVGWQTCDGIGFRVRYWDYDNTASATQSSSGPTVPDQAVHSWDNNVLDVELIMNRWGDRLWDTTLSAGYRLADYEEGAAALLDGAELANVNTRYFGNGFTGAAEVRVPVGSWFGLVVNTRGSLLFGNQQVNESNVTLPPIPAEQSFDAKYILETQLAGELRLPICGGGNWFARGGFEVQYWDDFVVQLEQKDATSVVFSGFFVSVGLQR